VVLAALASAGFIAVAFESPFYAPMVVAVAVAAVLLGIGLLTYRGSTGRRLRS
jgi:hypothetical protein